MSDLLNFPQPIETDLTGSILAHPVCFRLFPGDSTGKIAGDYRLDPPDEPLYDAEPEDGPITFRKHGKPEDGWPVLGWFWFDSSIDDADHGPFPLQGDALDDWDLTKFGDDTAPDVAELIGALNRFDLSVEGPKPLLSVIKI